MLHLQTDMLVYWVAGWENVVVLRLFRFGMQEMAKSCMCILAIRIWFFQWKSVGTALQAKWICNAHLLKWREVDINWLGWHKCKTLWILTEKDLLQSVLTALFYPKQLVPWVVVNHRGSGFSSWNFMMPITYHVLPSTVGLSLKVSFFIYTWLMSTVDPLWEIKSNQKRRRR